MAAVSPETPLRLDARAFRVLLEKFGPSLGLWRAAEVAVLRSVSLPAPVLDLGCGDGLVMSLVLPRIEIGLDPDAATLQRTAFLGLYERLLTVPGEAMPLPDGSVNTVVSNSVLEHIVPVDPVLREVARVLRPGGSLVVTTPSARFSRSLLLPAARYAARRNAHWQHHNLWTAEEWAAHLTAAGLEPVSARSYMPPAYTRLWDGLELLQQIWIGRQRLVSLGWRRLSPAALDRLAGLCARLDLSAGDNGGGQMIVAVKR